MVRWIVGSSLRNRFIVVALAAGMMFFGVVQIRDMPVDVYPEFAPPRVEVQTASWGLSSEEVEALVTVPLEQELSGIPGLDVMYSKSVSQLSSIEMRFELGTDLLEARQLVAERLNTVTPRLPTWAAPPIIMPALSSTSRVMKIGLSSDEMSVSQMSMIAYWTIRQRLLRVPGVANVAMWGERLQQMQVRVDPDRLLAHHITLNQVMRSTGGALESGLLKYTSGSVVGTGGFIDTPNQRLSVRHVLPIVTPQDLAQVSVEGATGKGLRLGDVADVVEGHQPLSGDAVINDGPGLLLVVEKFPWGNTVEVTRGVESAIDELRPGLSGIDINTTIFRPATFVEMSIDNLTRALIIGFLLVVLILSLFLFEWRVAVISLVTIPMSLMAAGLVLYFRGATLNTMILAGLVIALGEVVDDAIIDIENITRRLRQHRRAGSDKSIVSIILEASVEVRSSIVFATLIILVALAPIFFMGGLSGAFFEPLALSYALAIVASMGVALTVTPALALIMLRNVPLERRESPVTRWLQHSYSAILGRIVAKPGAAYVTAGGTVLAGLIVVPLLGQSLFPTFKERDFLSHWVTTPGTSHQEVQRITVQASREIRAIPGVNSFGSHIGQALAGEEVVGMNFAENWISVDPDADYDETVAAIQEVVDGYPGLYRDVQTYLKERIGEVLTGEGDQIVVRIFGPDLDVLRAKAQEVKQILSGIDGVVEEHVELEVDIPQVQVKVDLAAAKGYGLKPGDVRRAAATLVAGEEVGDIFRDNKAYDVMVWSTPQTRKSVTDIENLPIDTPSGDRVRLADVAKVALLPTPNAIQHEDGSRRIDVGANVRGADLGSVVSQLNDGLEQVDFPLEYHAEVLGEYAERQAAQQRLFVLGAVAMIAVFILLQVSFGSWRVATLVFLGLPMALVGGVIAAYFSDGVISLGSLVGFFTVLGIASRNGIMLIKHYQHLERQEGETFGPALVLRGARERLAPILMTALATGLALVPLALTGNEPGHEIEHPLAVVILGGLVTSTLLNLFVVPSLYLRFARPDTQTTPTSGLAPRST
jgi:CzcA family heavy metal efflux pump